MTDQPNERERLAALWQRHLYHRDELEAFSYELTTSDVDFLFSLADQTRRENKPFVSKFIYNRDGSTEITQQAGDAPAKGGSGHLEPRMTEQPTGSPSATPPPREQGDEMKKPWWYPEPADSKWCARLRKDYPDDAGLDDETLKDKYNQTGGKYAVTWDDIGDAYEEYEKLADAYFRLVAKNRKATP